MKRLVLLLCLCLLVVPVLGTRDTFQSWASPNWIATATTTTISTPPSNGEIVLSGGGITGSSGGIINSAPLAVSYVAFDGTASDGHGTQVPQMYLYDGSMSLIGSVNFGYSSGHRYEMKIIGMAPTTFIDGVQQSTYAVLTQNPTYVKLTCGSGGGYVCNPTWDNIVYGELDHHIVGALPSNWSIIRDMNTAATGVYSWSGTAWVLQNSYNAYIDANKEGLVTENVIIRNYNTGTTVNTTIVSKTATKIQYNIADLLNTPTSLGTTLPDGMYTVSFQNSPAIYDTFWIISSGASMSWGQSVYSQGSTGVITYAIAGSGYWDQSVYSYSMVTKSIYGTTMNTQTISLQSGTISVPITTAYSPGVYYSEIIATKISDGTTNVMAIAYTSVTTYIPMTGYVMNEETGATIAAANMNVTQGLQTQTVTSGFNGNWSSNNGWVSGSEITINTTASGFRQNIHSFTPLTSSAVALNISMAPTTPSYSGVSIGGVVSDNQYGNPVVGATYHVLNGTEYTATTNIAGFARVDGLVNGNLYNVWSSKTGYGNSSVTQIVARGV